MRKEEVLQRLKDLQAKYGSRYGQMPSPQETLEIYSAELEMSQCRGCCGLPCQKGTGKCLQPTIKIEYGRYYVPKIECMYSRAATIAAASVESGVPRRYAGKTYDDYLRTADNELAIRAAKKYARGKPRRWLYLYGGCGTGKTFLASLIAQELIATGLEVVFRDYQRILEELKSSFDDKAVTASAVLEKYQTCEVLILDDVGTGWFRDWGVSVLHQIINERYNLELRTVLTSNYDLRGLESRLSAAEEYAAARIISRLREESDVIYMGASDYRERT